MKYGTIPHLDKPVSRILCGTDYLMGQAPWTSFSAYDKFWELGGRGFDTARCYGDNTAIFGAWLTARGVAAEAILFDKIGHPDRDGSTIRRDKMRAELARNHTLLGVEKTDLCVLHRDDESVPVGEIVDWLDELVREGRISAFGGSNWRWERIRDANEYAAANGKQGFSLNNPTFSLAIAKEPMWADCVTLDEPGRAWHAETGFPLFLWSSTARGWFAHVDDHDKDVKRVYDDETNRARRERAETLGAEKGLSAVQIALAYVLSQPGEVFALCGLRTKENAEQNCAAADVVLTADEIRYLETGERVS